MGYGDFSPVTDNGRLFTIFFAFFSIAVVGVALGTVVGYVIEHEAKLEKKCLFRWGNL